MMAHVILVVFLITLALHCLLLGPENWIRLAVGTIHSGFVLIDIFHIWECVVEPEAVVKSHVGRVKAVVMLLVLVQSFDLFMSEKA